MSNYKAKLYRNGMGEDVYEGYSFDLLNESKLNRVRRIDKEQKHLRKKKGSAWEALYRYLLEGMWD